MEQGQHKEILTDLLMLEIKAFLSALQKGGRKESRVVCSKNASLKIFVVVTPKEGLVSRARFWYDTNYRFVIYSLHRLYCIVDVISKEGFLLMSPHQSFFWYDNEKYIKRHIFAAYNSKENLLLSTSFVKHWDRYIGKIMLPVLFLHNHVGKNWGI